MPLLMASCSVAGSCSSDLPAASSSASISPRLPPASRKTSTEGSFHEIIFCCDTADTISDAEIDSEALSSS